MVENLLLVEKYRPRSVSDCILPARIKDSIQDAIDSNNLQHMIFHGPAGAGKTSLAKAICGDISGDMLYINASNETGIDVVRNKVSNFASTMSFDGNMKVVLLDECLSEDETVRVGHTDLWKPVALKEFELGQEYPIVSFNESTQEFENDTGSIISDKVDDMYEVMLDNGKSVVCNKKHPFMCQAPDGSIVQRTIEDGLDGYLVIVADD
jgi:DNA polymerase III delta prime subunit